MNINKKNQMKNNKKTLNYKKKHNKLNRILVVSTMSSGKSTLINALIGRDLLPSRNDACTAKVIRYIQNNRLRHIKAIAYGEKEVEFNNVTKESLAEINSNQEYNSIMLTGPIKSIYKYNNSIEIIDTPGTNNSQDENHMNITLNFLESGQFDVILYILNATQLGINDDLVLLTKIKQYLDKNRQKKIVFVLNKMDQIDEEIESIEDIYNNAIKYIKKIGIDEVKLVSISADLAKIIKKDKYEALSKIEERKFKMYKSMFLECNNSLYNYQNIVKNIGKERFKDKTINKELLMKSGIVVLEKYLLNI